MCIVGFSTTQDLELSVPDRLEKYSGKLVELGRAVGRLAAAGKKVSIKQQATKTTLSRKLFCGRGPSTLGRTHNQSRCGSWLDMTSIPCRHGATQGQRKLSSALASIYKVSSSHHYLLMTWHGMAWAVAPGALADVCMHFFLPVYLLHLPLCSLLVSCSFSGDMT